MKVHLLSIWKNHSLTIILALIGSFLCGFAFFFNEKWFDLILGLGQGVLTTGAVFFFSRFFKETAKPEDDP